MKFSQLNKALLLTLFLSSVSNAQQVAGCIHNQGQYCDSCFNRKPLAPKQGCGPVVPDTDHCEIYNYIAPTKKISCGLCKPGYASHIGAHTGPQCTKGVIKGCRVELQLGPKALCLGCMKDGYYAYLNSYTGNLECQLPPKNHPGVDNCQWGSIINIGKFGCYKCQKGYNLTKDLSHCLPSKFKGCWILSQDQKSCENCDVFDGYSMQADKTCAQVSTH